jgi:hypothetical protein
MIAKPAGLLLMIAMASPLLAQAAGELPTTRAGLDAAIAARFAAADTNHDGQIDRAEAAAAIGLAAQAVSRRSGSALFDVETGPDGRPRLSLSEDGPLGQRGMFDTLFAQIDANDDDRLSLPEVQNAARAQFDMADRNRDGTLSPAELNAARGQLSWLQQSLNGAH